MTRENESDREEHTRTLIDLTDELSILKHNPMFQNSLYLPNNNNNKMTLLLLFLFHFQSNDTICCCVYVWWQSQFNFKNEIEMENEYSQSLAWKITISTLCSLYTKQYTLFFFLWLQANRKKTAHTEREIW